MSTTINQIQDALKVIEAKMKSGKALEIIEEYYHDNIVMIDGDQKGGYLTTTGKKAVTEREAGFFACLKAMNEHKLVTASIAISDKPEYDYVVFSTWYFDMAMDFGSGAVSYKGDQADVSYWKDGKITHETFFNPTTLVSSYL
jgi:hypothetical protein